VRLQSRSAKPCLMILSATGRLTFHFWQSVAIA
jgi:hypothetical protein